jgi:hypothetical protein
MASIGRTCVLVGALSAAFLVRATPADAQIVAQPTQAPALAPPADVASSDALGIAVPTGWADTSDPVVANYALAFMEPRIGPESPITRVTAGLVDATTHTLVGTMSVEEGPSRAEINQKYVDRLGEGQGVRRLLHQGGAAGAHVIDSRLLTVAGAHVARFVIDQGAGAFAVRFVQYHLRSATRFATVTFRFPTSAYDAQLPILDATILRTTGMAEPAGSVATNARLIGFVALLVGLVALRFTLANRQLGRRSVRAWEGGAPTSNAARAVFGPFDLDRTGVFVVVEDGRVLLVSTPLKVTTYRLPMTWYVAMAAFAIFSFPRTWPVSVGILAVVFAANEAWARAQRRKASVWTARLAGASLERLARDAVTSWHDGDVVQTVQRLGWRGVNLELELVDGRRIVLTTSDDAERARTEARLRVAASKSAA